MRLALWRATDRSFKTATEGLTRVKTNVAAKIKEDDPSPDFSREDPQTSSTDPSSYTVDTKAWEARLRRISAPFLDDALIFRSDVTLTIDADNRRPTKRRTASNQYRSAQLSIVGAQRRRRRG